MKKWTNGGETLHYWDGDNIVAEKLVNRTSVYARGLSLISCKSNTRKGYYVQNAHGDITKIVPSGDGITVDYEYDAYGNCEQEKDRYGNPFRYCGEYWDEETENIYLRARYYDSSTGRFISEDTHWNVNNMIYGDKTQIAEYKLNKDDNCLKPNNIYLDKINYDKNLDNEDKDNTYKKTIRVPDLYSIKQSNNLYIYCLNNPLSFWDKTGNKVTGYGISASASAVIGITGQYLWVSDDYGNYGMLSVVGAKNAIGLSLEGISFVFPNMDNISEMEGVGFSLGGNIGPWGSSVITSGDYVGTAWSVGVGGSVDVWIGGEGTYTQFIYSYNIHNIGESIKNWFIDLFS